MKNKVDENVLVYTRYTPDFFRREPIGRTLKEFQRSDGYPEEKIRLLSIYMKHHCQIFSKNQGFILKIKTNRLSLKLL